MKQQPVLSLKDTTLSKIVKQMQNGKNLLTDNQYYILREKELSVLFKMNLIVITKRRVFLCRLQAALFSSETKFNSGTGWQVLCLIKNRERRLEQLGMVRGELYVLVVMVIWDTF
jgi:peptide methionine sulfoxide reductase MsrB